MKKIWFPIFGIPLLFVSLFLQNGFAVEVTERFSIGGTIAGAFQYQHVDGKIDSDDTGRGAVIFQPDIRFSLTETDEIAAKFGFAGGNGINGISPFITPSWCVDLEDDVKEINGRNRDYLLTAWYKHTFEFEEAHRLEVTAGIIDATEYLDENAFANDGMTQFLNGALVNGPHCRFPSYDIGGSLKWNFNNFHINGVYMDVGRNEDENHFQFYGIQFGYALNTSVGEGNYRVIFTTSSKSFLDPQGENEEPLKAILFSFDQHLGEKYGVWVRFGSQEDDAAVEIRSIVSAGIHFSGKIWGREKDSAGIGYAYLEGGNLGLKNARIAEGYGRIMLSDILAATVDVQYQENGYENGVNIKGVTYGVRLTAEF